MIEIPDPDWKAEYERLRSALVQIGGLCVWAGWAKSDPPSFAHVPSICRSYVEIKRVAEEATGLDFSEYA